MWLAAAAAVLALAGTWLGQWQLDRAAANRELKARYAAALEQPPARIAVVPPSLAPGMRFRVVRLEGRYDPGRQVLLDNRVVNGRVGYEVLTPFRAAGGGPLLLVNRGWLPAAPDRRTLPAIRVDAAERQVVGVLDLLPRPGLSLGRPGDAGAETADALVVMSYPSAAEVAAALGAPVTDYQLRLDPAEPDGYVRAQGEPGLPPERNVAYAVQWFSLAAAAAAGGAWVIALAVRRRMR